MHKKNILSVVLIILLLIFTLTVSFWLINRSSRQQIQPSDRPAIEDELPPDRLWSERDKLTDFPARVISVQDDKIEAVVIIANGEEEVFYPQIVIDEDTQVISLRSDESADFPRLIREPGILPEIEKNMAITVHANDNIREHQLITANMISYKPGSQEGWLTEFEGMIIDLDNNKILLLVYIEDNGFDEDEIPGQEVTVLITDKTELNRDPKNMQPGDMIGILADRSIIHYESTVRALIIN